MKHRVKTVSVLLLLAAVMSAWAQQSATVRSATGKVEYRTAPGAPWQAVSVGLELPLGAGISTGFGARATLEFGYTTLVVESLSRLTLEDLIEREGAVETDLMLNVGRVRAEVRDAAGLEHNFRLRSTQATAAVRGTDFVFDGVNIQVFSGVVTMLNRFSQGSSVGGGGRSSVPDDERPPAGGEGLEQLLAVIPYAPGSGERETGSGAGTDGEPKPGTLVFDYC